MNLINLLPDEDKVLMEKFIHLYGIGEKDFIGLDEYLKYWAESKKKLYKMLGNQFQIEIPFSHEKTHFEMQYRFNSLLEHKFINTLTRAIYNEFYYEVDLKNYLWDFCSRNIYLEDKTEKSIKFKPSEDAKEIRLQAGMKPLRALQRIVTAYPSIFSMEEFEEFRIKHSLCLNDKFIKGTLVLSIHPFDFLTMSDNGSDWSSCMSWVNNGCYHIGTVEMMNSNNTIVAYVKSSNPYYFGKNTKDKSLVWNNKKWRQLMYVTKDILVSGKPYPYASKEVTLTALQELKKLAEENLSWTYNYGPELYSDMVHINSLSAMENNKRWLQTGDTFKHNIIFDTKGMYNDMLNDNDTNYWCFRNKVPKMKIISVSGKAPCLGCGGQVLYQSDYPEDYNDRWRDPEKVVCDACIDDGECNICYHFIGRKSIIKLPYNNTKICPHCAETLLKKCPCCGEPFLIERYNASEMPGIQIEDNVSYRDYNYFNKKYYDNFTEYSQKFDNHVRPYSEMTVIPAFICNNCLQTDLKNLNGLFMEKSLGKNTFMFAFAPPTMTKIITRQKYTEQEILEHPMLSKMLRINLERYEVNKKS